MPPTLTQHGGRTTFGPRHIPDDALDLICCCALFTAYQPFQLANLFNGLLRSHDGVNWTIAAHADLQGVKASEIRALAWKLCDASHPAWTVWGEKPDAPGSAADRCIVKPLLDAGLPPAFRYPDRAYKLSWGSLVTAVLAARFHYPDRSRYRTLAAKPGWERACTYDEDRL